MKWRGSNSMLINPPGRPQNIYKYNSYNISCKQSYNKTTYGEDYFV